MACSAGLREVRRKFQVKASLKNPSEVLGVNQAIRELEYWSHGVFAR